MSGHVDSWCTSAQPAVRQEEAPRQRADRESVVDFDLSGAPQKCSTGVVRPPVIRYSHLKGVRAPLGGWAYQRREPRRAAG